MEWQQPIKPFDLTYSQLIKAILNGVYPPGSYLPGERQMALALGVTRPTLREVMQRLAADGWLEIQQGRSTRVKDIWLEGSLNTLGTLVRYIDELPTGFISNLLQVRTALAPAYAFAAINNAPDELCLFISGKSPRIDASAREFAAFDWELHYQMTVLSGNPIYTLILNGFAGIYPIMAERYFYLESARKTSAQFYEQLFKAASDKDPHIGENLVKHVMELSLSFWHEVSALPMEDER